MKEVLRDKNNKRMETEAGAKKVLNYIGFWGVKNSFHLYSSNLIYSATKAKFFK